MKLLLPLACAASLFLLSGCKSDLPYIGEVSILPGNSTQFSHRGDNLPVSFVSEWSKRGGHANTGEHRGLQPGLDDLRVMTADVKGELLARDRVTGRTLWQSDAPGSITSGPVVNNGLLIVGTQSGLLVAFDNENGKKLWSKQLTSSIIAPPLVTEEAIYAKSFDGCVVKLSRDGENQWSYCHKKQGMMLSGSSAVAMADNGMLITGFSDGQVAAIDERTGEVRWQQLLAEPQADGLGQHLLDITADPVIIDDVAFLVSNSGYMAALSVDTGDMLWRYKTSSFAGLAGAYQHVFISDNKNQVHALSVDTGAIDWELNSLSDRKLSPPVVMDDYLIMGDDSGYLIAISAQDGKIVAQTRVDSSAIVSRPSVSNHSVYVLTKNGTIAAYHLDTVAH